VRGGGLPNTCHGGVTTYEEFCGDYFWLGEKTGLRCYDSKKIC
jgi:hypothetical protein